MFLPASLSESLFYAWWSRGMLLWVLVPSVNSLCWELKVILRLQFSHDFFCFYLTCSNMEVEEMDTGEWRDACIYFSVHVLLHVAFRIPPLDFCSVQTNHLNQWFSPRPVCLWCADMPQGFQWKKLSTSSHLWLKQSEKVACKSCSHIWVIQPVEYIWFRLYSDQIGWSGKNAGYLIYLNGACLCWLRRSELQWLPNT